VVVWKEKEFVDPPEGLDPKVGWEGPNPFVLVLGVPNVVGWVGAPKGGGGLGFPKGCGLGFPKEDGLDPNVCGLLLLPKGGGLDPKVCGLGFPKVCGLLLLPKGGGLGFPKVCGLLLLPKVVPMVLVWFPLDPKVGVEPKAGALGLLLGLVPMELFWFPLDPKGAAFDANPVLVPNPVLVVDPKVAAVPNGVVPLVLPKLGAVFKVDPPKGVLVLGVVVVAIVPNPKAFVFVPVEEGMEFVVKAGGFMVLVEPNVKPGLLSPVGMVVGLLGAVVTPLGVGALESGVVPNPNAVGLGGSVVVEVLPVPKVKPEGVEEPVPNEKLGLGGSVLVVGWASFGGSALGAPNRNGACVLETD
jgi:hypothetical protein